MFRRELPESIDYRSVKVGDILLFRAPKKHEFDTRVIINSQSLIRRKLGHNETTHAAIVTGQSPIHGPLIAHVTEKGKEGMPDYVLGYLEEPLKDQIERDLDRSFILFRHSVETFTNEIARLAGDKINNSSLKWKTFPGIKAIIFAMFDKRDSKRLVATENSKDLSRSTICSQFVVQTIKKAARISHQKHCERKTRPANMINGYLDVRSNCTPKTLEDHLTNRPDFCSLAYYGKQPLQQLISELENQLSRLRNKNNPKSRAKYKELEKTYAEFKETVKLDISPTEIEKCQLLLSKIIPIVNRSTGIGLFQPTSARKLTDLAKSMGFLGVSMPMGSFAAT